MKKNKKLILFPVLFVLLSSCAGMQPKNPEDMTPKEVAVWANRTYEQQYNAYLQDYEYARNNAEMARVLKKKKRVMLEIYPLLISYNEFIKSGTVPPQQMTDTIIQLIYNLTGIY